MTMSTFRGCLVFSLFFLALAGAPASAIAKRPNLVEFFNSGASGGGTCAACTIVTALVEQLTEIYNISVSDALSRFCGFLPTGFQEACKTVVEEYGPEVIELLEKRETPDVVCNAIDLCDNKACHLFPQPKEGLPARGARAARLAAAKRRYARRLFKFPDLCNISIVKPICDIIERFGEDHLPIDDLDGDYFSDLQTFRGTDWRGKDCRDTDKSIYPGRHTTDDAFFDTNCNGIYGTDSDSGKTYETLWCNGTQQMGTILLGDSAGAHFHLPPAWFTSKELSVEAFQDLFFILENEFDWPMLSSSTAFKNSTWKDISGKVDSTYLRMREINRCNHRDYQNIGVNGARSSAMADTIVKGFGRHGTLDNPAFVTYALVGNDVCSGHHDESHMTTPEDFYANSLKTFRYVDERVSPGSVLSAIGLVDGRVLYNSLHNRIHPIGSLHNDVTYAQFYDYLNCLELSPCFGWMNSNETWRNRTSERAMELNVALRELVANESFNNFKAHYSDPPFALVFKQWEEKGGEPWQLIEPVDGFHPNQQANALLTEVTWELMRNETPWMIPPTNPNNAKIKAKFGDQGGY